MVSKTEFSSADLDFLKAAEGALSVRCCCQFEQVHRGYCNQPAAVTIKMHLPHHCKRPDLIAQGVVDGDGNVTQILCRGCYQEVRDFCEAKIAQTHAICTQLSLQCQRCQFTLARYHEGTLSTFDACPRCATERIVFEPVCGAGKESHGCGAPLLVYSDIIRNEVWMP